MRRLLLIAFFLVLLMPIVSADWSNWNYYKVIQIKNTDGNHINESINLTFDTASLISASKMQSDCKDIRTICNGLEYEMNISGCNNLATNITFFVSSNATSNLTCQVYYGNPTETETKNVLSYIWDDFSANTTQFFKSEGAGTFTIDSGIMQLAGTGWINSHRNITGYSKTMTSQVKISGKQYHSLSIDMNGPNPEIDGYTMQCGNDGDGGCFIWHYPQGVTQYDSVAWGVNTTLWYNYSLQILNHDGVSSVDFNAKQQNSTAWTYWDNTFSSSAIGINGTIGFLSNVITLQVDNVCSVNRPWNCYTYTNKPLWSVGTEITGGPPVFSITAKDYYDSTAINTFTAYVSNASGLWVLSTINGTIKSADIALSRLYNITISATDYFNKTYTSWNSSTNLAAITYQSVLNVFASEMATGYSLTGFNVTVPMQVNTTTGNNVTLYLKAGAYTLTFSKGGYFNQTKSYTAVARTTASTTITDVFNGYLNITAQSFNTSKINEFTVYAYGLNNSYTDNFTTTNGTVRFPVINGSYNITMDAVNYALAYHTVISSSSMTNYTFTLYQTNTFFFYFKDIETKSLVELSTLEMISGLFAGNYSAPNGTLNMSLIVPGDYTFRYTAPGYMKSLYFFTLVNKTVNNITLYLISNVSATDVTATVYDQIGNVIEGVVIKVLRYDLTSNSYLLNEMAETNFEGKTILHLNLNTEFYQFLIEYGGVLKKITTPGIVLQNAIAFQIVLGAEVGEEFKNYQDIDYSLIFNNATDSFRLTYSDNNNLVSSVCMKVYRLTGTDQTLVNTTCLSTASGTILVGVSHINGSLYKGSAYVYYGSGESYLLASLLHGFPSGSITNLIGIFMIALLTIVFFCAGFWRPILIPILTPLPVVVGSIIGLIPIPTYITIPLEVCGLIIAYVISDKS